MRPRRPARELRTAIDCMPVHTRQAMLDGMGQTTIIVGGYTDGNGGVCPMLAAHRNGGRTSYATFAHAWDRYTKAGTGARPATERELAALRGMLEASIEAEEVVGTGVLGETVRHHRALQEGRAKREEFDVEPLEPEPVLEDVPRSHELDLGHEAVGRGREQVADRACHV